MHALPLEYGLPVQRSAFEGRLTAAERGRLAARAEPFIDPATDMLVIYTVPRDQERAIRALGMPRPPVHEQRWFIV
jgi:CRISPR/Cas system-associated endoribonuclease Cas2